MLPQESSVDFPDKLAPCSLSDCDCESLLLYRSPKLPRTHRRLNYVSYVLDCKISLFSGRIITTTLYHRLSSVSSPKHFPASSSSFRHFEKMPRHFRLRYRRDEKRSSLSGYLTFYLMRTDVALDVLFSTSAPERSFRSLQKMVIFSRK